MIKELTCGNYLNDYLDGAGLNYKYSQVGDHNKLVRICRAALKAIANLAFTYLILYPLFSMSATLAPAILPVALTIGMVTFLCSLQSESDAIVNKVDSFLRNFGYRL